MKKFFIALFAGVVAALAIGLLALFDSLPSDVLFLMAPFGATAVIVFGLPDSPLARPKNVIFGHLLTTAVGMVTLALLGDGVWSMGIAVGAAISLMLLSDTTHPPAGANPIVVFALQPSLQFLLFPVLTGAVFLTVVAWSYRQVRSRWLASYLAAN